MRHAILIHTHRFPEQFKRLCRALEHPDFDIWVNIDLKTDIEPFRKAAPNVNYVEKRINIRWGNWTQVEATFNSLEEIMASGKEYGYVIFISGQDYPLRPPGDISDYLEKHKGKEFIAEATRPSASTQRKWDRRYTKRWYFHRRNFTISSLVSKYILHLLPAQKPPYKIYKGSNWWNLSTQCVRYLLDYRRDNRDIIHSYRNSFCADEMFFQSTLRASPFADRLVNNNFRYIIWAPPSSYPKTLTTENYDAIVESDAWFGRKFDLRVDTEIFDLLDARVMGKRQDTSK